jgi:hypothetical protein
MAQTHRMAPTEQTVRVLGIHPVQISKDTLLENARLEFGERFNLDDVLGLDDGAFRNRFSNIYLVEVLIERLDSDFDPGTFTQEQAGAPRDNWQVPYDEKFLDADGISERSPPSGLSSTRLAFFMHDLNPSRPLQTQYGPVSLPQPTPMPVRLSSLFRYFPPS